jgi:hypothetical protein
MSLSPSLTPVSVLRSHGIRPSFDGLDELSSGGIMAQPSNGGGGGGGTGIGTATGTGVGTTGVVGTGLGTAGGPGTGHSNRGLSLIVEIRDLTLTQKASHMEMWSYLKDFPPLDGLISPEPEQLDTYLPLKKYLSAALCPFVDPGYYLSLHCLINIVTHMPQFNKATPAIIAAAVICNEFHDPLTWTRSLTSKLDQWSVKACFWDVHIPRTSWIPATYDRFHKQLIMTALDLSLGPVCLTGHSFILPVVWGYWTLLSSATKVIEKHVEDCIADLFQLRKNFNMLVDTQYADGLDGMSIPLPSVMKTYSDWTLNLTREQHVTDAADILPEDVLDDVVKVALPYAWMFVAANYMAFPETVYKEGSTYDNVAICWDECK